MWQEEREDQSQGEKFDMHKAKEICERYRGILPTSATVADVIVFWFKDADCKAENKVVEYLREY